MDDAMAEAYASQIDSFETLRSDSCQFPILTNPAALECERLKAVKGIADAVP
jgi:hypothetical protein